METTAALTVPNLGLQRRIFTELLMRGPLSESQLAVSVLCVDGSQLRETLRSMRLEGYIGIKNEECHRTSDGYDRVYKYNISGRPQFGANHRGIIGFLRGIFVY